jgi:hypothetical protein
MLSSKNAVVLFHFICVGFFFAFTPVTLHAQSTTACQIQLFTPVNDVGSYKFKVENNALTSGNLSDGSKVNLGSDCGELTFNARNQTYRWSPAWWLYAKYLIVAGGGGGGAASGITGAGAGGGGGGGGILSGVTNIEPGQKYELTVGAGGRGLQIVNSGNTNGNRSGQSGRNSTGFGLTAIGGGGGGSGAFWNDAGGKSRKIFTGLAGGSGGGSGGGQIGSDVVTAHVVKGGEGTVGQGFEGGHSNIQARCNCWVGGGGGGGAGGAGDVSSILLAGPGQSFVVSGGTGKGGDGLLSDITGENVYYSAGGGGSIPKSATNDNGGSKGAGGGGGDYASIQALNGTTPGSGGGGTAQLIPVAPFKKAGNGSGGIIVINAWSLSAGDNNTYLGFQSGLLNMAFANTFVGANAGANDTAGKGNIFIGSSSGATTSEVAPLHTNIITLGAQSTVKAPLIPTNSIDNVISIGYQSSGRANQITLGNSALRAFRVGNLTAWPTPSDRALKTNIVDSTRGLSFIRQLKPVEYQFKGSEDPRIGFIAQEVEQAEPQFPGLLKPQDAVDFYALQYDSFIPSLVKSVQELHGQIQAFNAPPARASGLGPLKWIAMLCALTLACLGACLYMHMRIRACAALPERV